MQLQFMAHEGLSKKQLKNNNGWIIWNVWINQHKTGTVSIARKYLVKWIILISKLTLSGSGHHLYRKNKTMRKP